MPNPTPHNVNASKVVLQYVETGDAAHVQSAHVHVRAIGTTVIAECLVPLGQREILLQAIEEGLNGRIVGGRWTLVEGDND